jgi:hypothetical protein
MTQVSYAGQCLQGPLDSLCSGRILRSIGIAIVKSYPCPCCGYLTFEEPPGSYEICPICFWEDDLVQLAFPDMAGGANKVSLIEGQRNFDSFRACERRLIGHVRKPARNELRDRFWRALDPHSDVYLKWNVKGDHDLWQSVKDCHGCLYYWLPEYWLNKTAQ